jgi:START domain
MFTFFLRIIVLCFFPSGLLFAQSSWDLKKDKDHILIYTRAVKNSKFNELKAVFDLPGSFKQLRSILEDVTHYKDWAYCTTFSKLLEKRSDSEIVYYSQISAPWPISSRDFCSDTRIWMDSAKQELHISSQNLNNLLPPKDHLVRMPFLKAEWIVTMPSPALLHVEYTLSWNPGGSIPAWVANMFSTTGPFQSFSQLRKKMGLLNP